MKNARLVWIAAIALVVAWSCRKDETTETPGTPPPAGSHSFAAFFEGNIADATQTFSIDAANGGQRTGAKGTRLIFEPGAFVHADGTPVVGNVTVSLVEALTVGDMVKLNKQTVGDDNGTLRLLVSGGAINVYAEQGGNEVQVTPGGLIARIPTDVADPAMTLFSGREDAQGNMIWDPIDSAIIDTDPTYYDSTDYTFPYYFYYPLNPPGFNWINCDYFWNASTMTTISATPPAGSTTDSTLVWITFPTINSMASMYLNGTGGWNSFQIPVGISATVIGLRQEGSGYSSTFQEITVTENMIVPLVFTPTTLDDFELALEGL